ncbi:hypothetical protein CAPTEDRAFT_214443 [Capitella teleta]|uniref:Doublecortin domain-containing protein n=1 Tax=Capitella teleta TaxID=283909 RepID=R7US79_CAPTE|nr:hypothetical protein CAPTEDRAFT_214443 [Capitella teleta]|eukprot:ELU08993.1 hypothetical protein CAPTEDRAFT_214443 [Capitella teleta]
MAQCKNKVHNKHFRCKEIVPQIHLTALYGLTISGGRCTGVGAFILNPPVQIDPVEEVRMSHWLPSLSILTIGADFVLFRLDACIPSTLHSVLDCSFAMETVSSSSSSRRLTNGNSTRATCNGGAASNVVSLPPINDDQTTFKVNGHRLRNGLPKVKPVEHSRLQVSARHRKVPTNVLTIFVYPNGRLLEPARRLTLTNTQLRNWESILLFITDRVNLASACRKLFNIDGTPVSGPADLCPMGQYVAVGGEVGGFKKLEYGMNRKPFNSSPKRDRKLNPIDYPKKRGSNRSSYNSSDSNQTSANTSSNKSSPSVPPGARIRPIRREPKKPSESEGPFHARPVKHKRSSEKDRPKEVDYDRDEGGIFKAKPATKQDAEVIEDTKETKVDVPIDQMKAEEVEKKPVSQRESSEGLVSSSLSAGERNSGLSAQSELRGSEEAKLLEDDFVPDLEDMGEETDVVAEREMNLEDVLDPDLQVEDNLDGLKDEEIDDVSPTPHAASLKQRTPTPKKSPSPVPKSATPPPAKHKSPTPPPPKSATPVRDPTPGVEKSPTPREKTPELMGETPREEPDAKPEEDKDAAAAKIQAGYRGYVSRQEVAKEKKVKEESEAATKIQANYRGYRSRKTTRDQKKEAEESPEEQTGEAEGSKEPVIKEVEEENPNVKEDDEVGASQSKTDYNQAAIKIQANYRGHLERKKIAKQRKKNFLISLKSKLAALFEIILCFKKNDAATKIQAGYRGYNTRKQLQDFPPPQDSAGIASLFTKLSTLNRLRFTFPKKRFCVLSRKENRKKRRRQKRRQKRRRRAASVAEEEEVKQSDSAPQPTPPSLEPDPRPVTDEEKSLRSAVEITEAQKASPTVEYTDENSDKGTPTPPGAAQEQAKSEDPAGEQEMTEREQSPAGGDAAL